MIRVRSLRREEEVDARTGRVRWNGWIDDAGGASGYENERLSPDQSGSMLVVRERCMGVLGGVGGLGRRYEYV